MKRKATTAGLGTLRLQHKRQMTRRTAPLYSIPRQPSEVKCTDLAVNNAAVGAAAGLVSNLFTNLVGGTSWYNQYVGQKIQPTSIELRYQFIVGDPTNICRLVLFQWYDNSTAPTAATVLQAVNSLAPKSMDNRSELKVLADRLHFMAILSTGGNNNCGDRIHIKKNKMTEAVYNAATGRYKGQLYALWLSDSTILPNPTVTFYSRVYFTDT